MSRIRSFTGAFLRKDERRRAIHFSMIATPLALVPALALVFALLLSGCTDDIKVYKPPEEESPFLPLTSPENLVHNIAKSYNLQECERIAELLCEDFVFVFSERDRNDHPDKVPQGGVWGCDEEIEATCNMLDPHYEPEDPEYKIDSIKMSMNLSGSLQRTNREEAPPGTLESWVNLDMFMETGGANIILCQSRPRFFFAPDSTQTPTLWCLWRCEDIQDYPWIPSDEVGAGQPNSGPGSQLEFYSGRSAMQRDELGAPAGETTSWGLIKLHYWNL